MNDIFLEVLVERKRDIFAMIMKVLFGILTVLSLLAMFMTPIALVAVVLFGGASYFFHMQELVEFEYSYVNRELSIDKIIAKSSRKHIGDFDVDKMEVGAMEKSYHLDEYRNQKYSVKDYSSKDEKEKFVIYYKTGNSCKLVLDADEALIKALRSVAPRKIFVD